ncbi:MAG: hypothetical protein JW932_02820, partial [Deltaproteobacteria bacterium]|nr:hypothetical protein [Deltaproteobacteria bacterium]
GEDQNHETSFIVKVLQAAVDDWCKIQVLTVLSLNRHHVRLKVFVFSTPASAGVTDKGESALSFRT